MAFHLEDHGLAIADIHHAGIFAGALDDAGALGGQRLQPFLGGLVGAVLVPHGRADAQFGHGGLAAQQLQEALIFVGLEAVLLDDVGGDLGGRRLWSCCGRFSRPQRDSQRHLDDNPRLGRGLALKNAVAELGP